MNTRAIHHAIYDYLNDYSVFDNSINDLAIIGSFSGHYGWRDTAFGDCDIWILCDDIRNNETWKTVKTMLNDLKLYLQFKFPSLCVLYEVAYGPYKPEVKNLVSDLLFLHITVDDFNSYKKHSDFTKLSWSKYRGFYSPTILYDLLIANEPISLNLLSVKYGIEDSIQVLKSKRFDIVKYDFNLNNFVVISYSLGDCAFSEYMLYVSMTNARNYFRAIGLAVADNLQNELFVNYFCDYLNNDSLKDIYTTKKSVEKYGYGIVDVNALYLKVLIFLEELSIAWRRLSCDLNY